MQTTREPIAETAEDQTLKYYADNARTYAKTTSEIDMSAVYDRFLRHLPSGGLILDAGSGSGRDTLAFIRRGFRVEAFDASPELCELSTKLTGIHTECLRFQQFDSPERYDGIWACASLLHVPSTELYDAVGRLVRALKPRGTFYMSFKWGDGERRAEDGRLYTDMDEGKLGTLFAAFPSIAIVDTWRSGGEGAHYGKDIWLNAIGLKSARGSER
jgi:SAM-dependent methyltransferase